MTYETRNYTIVNDSKAELADKYKAVGGLWIKNEVAWAIPTDMMEKLEKSYSGPNIYITPFGELRIAARGSGTHALKDQFKTITSAKYNGEEKVWTFNKSQEAEVRALINKPATAAL
jgi:hypothetical protein